MPKMCEVILGIGSKLEITVVSDFEDDNDDVFEYVEEVKGYRQSNKGGYYLVDQKGYSYSANRKSKTNDKAFWRCLLYKKCHCKATCVSRGNKITRLSGEHIHRPFEGNARQFKDKLFTDKTG